MTDLDRVLVTETAGGFYWTRSGEGQAVVTSAIFRTKRVTIRDAMRCNTDQGWVFHPFVQKE